MSEPTLKSILNKRRHIEEYRRRAFRYLWETKPIGSAELNGPIAYLEAARKKLKPPKPESKHEREFVADLIALGFCTPVVLDVSSEELCKWLDESRAYRQQGEAEGGSQ
jgi:hypothetical protein